MSYLGNGKGCAKNLERYVVPRAAINGTSVASACARCSLDCLTYSPGIPGSGLPTPATTFVNSFLGLRSTGGLHGWDGFLYVRNLFDARNYEVSTNQQVSLGVPTGYHNVFFQPERQYGVTVSYHY